MTSREGPDTTRTGRSAGLRRIAAQKNLLFGSALCTADLDDPAFEAALLRECGLLVPEYEMKWDWIAPGPEDRRFDEADRLAAFAARHGLALHGHAIWWHGAVPAWTDGLDDRAFARAALEHLDAAALRYAGRVRSWDVANEPLDVAHGRADGLRASRFLDALGPGWVGLAFREAAKRDPGALLVLNEMGLEYEGGEAQAKRLAMLALLERERGAGAPIHVLGIQSHLDAASRPGRHPELRAFLREVGASGLAVMITELDVDDRRVPGSVADRDEAVADAYRAFLDLVLEEAPVLSVATWGLSDRRSWLRAGEARPGRPLPLDRSLRRKPAWRAIAGALRSASSTSP